MRNELISATKINNTPANIAEALLMICGLSELEFVRGKGHSEYTTFMNSLTQ